MRFTFGTPHVCTYCGRPADSIDHSETQATLTDRLKQYIEQQQMLNNELRMRVSCRDSIDFLTILQEACDRLYYDKSLSDEHKRFLIDDDHIPSVSEAELP